MTRTDHPYTSGWPTWPFTRLGRKDMAELIKKLELEKREKLEEALL